MVVRPIAAHALAELLLEECASRRDDHSKKEWADQAGIHEKSWSKYTTGQVFPELPTIEHLATEFLHVPIHEFVAALCRRMAEVSDRGLKTTPTNALAPVAEIAPRIDEAMRAGRSPYVRPGPDLEVTEQAIRYGLAEDRLKLDGLSTEAIGVLIAVCSLLRRVDPGSE